MISLIANRAFSPSGFRCLPDRTELGYFPDVITNVVSSFHKLLGGLGQVAEPSIAGLKFPWSF